MIFHLRIPFLFLLLSLSLRRSESSCRSSCDLALGSYYITSEASNLTYVANFFNQKPTDVLPYNSLSSQDSIITGTRINIGFTCNCISGDFLGGNFSYTAQSGDTYDTIASDYYANLTTAAWLAATNSYPSSRIQIGDVINVVINCSCGDAGVSRDYGLFETYPLRPGETLDSVASYFNLSSQKSLIQQYNSGKDFGAGSGIVFVPTRDSNGSYRPFSSSKNGLSGGAIAGICVGVVVVLMVVIFLYFGVYGKKKAKKTLLPLESDHHSAPLRHDKNTTSAPREGSIAAATGLSVEKSVEFSLEELAKATNDFSMANKIGQGGFGSVYYAELRGEKAAIKKMDMEASREFLAELKVLTHVHHLNLVRLIGYCTEDSLFLVYEFIENGNLSQHLRGSGRDPLPWLSRVQIALDSARGLEYIHEHTVPVYIHRDIKSANILIDKNLRAKVADFGLTKLAEVGGATLQTRLVGTFGYMPPEFYKKAYHQLFKVSDRCSGRKLLVSNCEDYVSDYHCFGWLLFLALRTHAFSGFKDLVTYTNALVSILAILILHVPLSLRNFAISDSPFFIKKSDQGVDLLASLSQCYDASEVELRRMMETVNKLIVDVLEKKPCHASECKTESLYDINTDELTYFEYLLDEKSLQNNLLILNKDYDDIIKSKVELDERIFLNVEDNLDANGDLNFSGNAINLSRERVSNGAVTTPTKSIINCVASHPATSPANGNFVGNSRMAQWTPVSSTMTTAKWLREVVSPFPSRPSSGLQHFLASCDTDLTSPVIHRANIILEAIFPSHYGERCIPGSLQGANLMDRVWAEQRKLESLKLYYRVLEAICKAESQRLGDNNLTSLLSCERFHRCMLACAAELVLATHKTVTMMFPAVLERTGITAFDLSKVIESFVRHEETLPRELKRHLNSLEERLLESMSWEKGSSLYNSLIVAKPALAAEINRLGLLAEPMPSLDSIALHKNITTIGTQPSTSQKHGGSSGPNGDLRSPKRLCSENRGVVSDHNILKSPVRENLITFNSPRSKLPSLQSAFASPACPNPSTGGEPCAEAGISGFFSKILKLAAIRIRSLCERLGVPQQILEHVYFLIQQILSHRTALFFSRHIDQLILCSIYGVNKILNLDLSFKAIIYNYRKQPQCRTQVFKSVYVNSSSIHNTKKGQEHVDIITFYNAVFIPSVKPLLVELGSSKVENINSSAQDKSNNPNGHIPSSPRLSTFPNLPDMSPKKVSASHNVYVSPLRQSKMDALLAPSSKSYYACVGESTHAFQSPSKDLMVINSRLNCGSGRRVGGRLNFDLVSDSIVAGSLGPQNGSSGSSAADTTAIDVTIKSEQPDL